MDDISKAEILLLDKLKTNPNSYLLNFYFGTEYYWDDKSDKSIAYLNKSIKIEPNHNEPYGGLISIYENKGLIDQAFSTAKQAIKMNPDSAKCHEIIAYLNVKHKKDFKSAKIELEKALKLEPNNKKLKEGLKAIEYL